MTVTFRDDDKIVRCPRILGILVLRTKENFLKVMEQFHPQGKQAVNSTVWQGKEPRSCSVTKVRSGVHAVDGNDPVAFEFEVSYRPKGCITFVGNTKYDGWTAMVLNRAQDGTLLDEHGKPLPEGQPPVYLPYEVYDAIDFNLMNFGDFIGEFDVDAVKHRQWHDVMREVEHSSRFAVGLMPTFMSLRRERPNVKIALSNAPSGTRRDGWGTKIIGVSNSTPHLRQVLLDHITEIVSGFIEGRYSMNCMETGEIFFAELTGLLVDCTPNEEGKASRFDCLAEYLPPGYLDELAKRLMATYEIEVDVVEGEKIGLLLRHAIRE